jgi:trk system potassium uptake protein TrkH
MILSGINFSLYYFGFKNKLKKIKRNEELKYYLLILFIATIIISISLIDFSKPLLFSNLELAWRNSLFTATSLMTTTGFGTADYVQWHTYTWILLLMLMITGASAGSTSGAIKMVRIVIVFKYCYYEFKRMIHPNAIIPIRYSGHIVSESVITRILAFVLLYLITIGFSILVLNISGIGFHESIGGTVACLGGVGPGLGILGPMGNYADIPMFSKWFLSFIMLVGRLELFTVLLLFTPAFWKK